MRRFALTSVLLLLVAVPLVSAQQQPAQEFLRDPDAVESGDPAPRDATGKVLMGGSSARETGLWLPTVNTQYPLADPETIPFQPWAESLYADRQEHELEPHARCKPSSLSRPFLTPYGVEIVELPELQRIFIFDVGGPHTWRTIYMDGRTHPRDLEPSYLGHSIGWWEGDTLLIETTGYNEGTWMDRRGAPNSEKLRTLERITRTTYGTIEYEIDIEDSEVYTDRWTGGFNLRWVGDSELFEYVCQQGNQANELMLGDYDSVDRTTTIVP
jgi:hypothetical protein